eukprot:CAMPEP_0118990086 /NCGR_PEP_ID=MMETSP1173-20130426/49220_1 /TAXON_ID=1034831 /ORGANISM="Rhizochromulina marina cf, Strain CCMP1243" /LENGTH=106 /DNA_ID=CAMNT_0006941117 /DNA_START=228 /DNA_END=548 /DNA_ORIENTATION=+
MDEPGIPALTLILAPYPIHVVMKEHIDWVVGRGKASKAATNPLVYGTMGWMDACTEPLKPPGEHIVRIDPFETSTKDVLRPLRELVLLYLKHVFGGFLDLAAGSIW